MPARLPSVVSLFSTYSVLVFSKLYSGLCDKNCSEIQFQSLQGYVASSTAGNQTGLRVTSIRSLPPLLRPRLQTANIVCDLGSHDSSALAQTNWFAGCLCRFLYVSVARTAVIMSCELHEDAQIWRNTCAPLLEENFYFLELPKTSLLGRCK